MNDQVTSPRAEYDALVKANIKLTCLENEGVDNWSGWDNAMARYRAEVGQNGENNMTVIDMSRIELQNAEFDALTNLSKEWAMLRNVPVVDDDYPRARGRYEEARKVFVEAITANGRIA